jgi:hypothetical protein
MRLQRDTPQRSSLSPHERGVASVAVPLVILVKSGLYWERWANASTIDTCNRPITWRQHHKQGSRPAKEVYTGTAAAVGGQFGGASRPFTLEITGYTPDENVQQDFQVLRTQGQDDFMKAIKNKKLGIFAFEGQVGRDLNFILETQTENGRKITILFERWLQMFELRYGTRLQDYLCVVNTASAAWQGVQRKCGFA